MNRLIEALTGTIHLGNFSGVAAECQKFPISAHLIAQFTGLRRHND